MRDSALLEFQAPEAKPWESITLPLSAFRPKMTAALHLGIRYGEFYVRYREILRKDEKNKEAIQSKLVS